MNPITWILILVIIILIVYYLWRYYFSKQLNKHFYTEGDINQKFTKDIKHIYPTIKNEIMAMTDMSSNQWHDWPEKWLFKEYNDTKVWKALPLYGFGIWSTQNTKNCPVLANYLKSIPNLRLAMISRMAPGIVLDKHQGWGFYSNHAIRCHFGIDVPENCFVSVTNEKGEEKIKYHENGKWLIFDDSKTHSASNLSNKERIVLIIDIERPKNIEIGKSQFGDKEEFMNVIKELRQEQYIPAFSIDNQQY